jgi:hypothetical protein
MRTTLIFVLAHAALCGSADAQSIAIKNATVYTSPDASAQTHTTILIQAVHGFGGRANHIAQHASSNKSTRLLYRKRHIELEVW